MACFFITVVFLANWFKNLHNKLASSGLAFNVCVVKTQNLINKVSFYLSNQGIKVNTQWYASFGTGSTKQNTCTTNARAYYVSTYQQDMAIYSMHIPLVLKMH